MHTSVVVSRGRGKASVLPAWMTDPVLAQQAQSSVKKLTEDKTIANPAHPFKSRFDQKPEDFTPERPKKTLCRRSKSHSSGMRTSSSNEEVEGEEDRGKRRKKQSSAVSSSPHSRETLRESKEMMEVASVSHQHDVKGGSCRLTKWKSSHGIQNDQRNDFFSLSVSSNSHHRSESSFPLEPLPQPLLQSSLRATDDCSSPCHLNKCLLSEQNCFKEPYQRSTKNNSLSKTFHKMSTDQPLKASSTVNCVAEISRSCFNYSKRNRSASHDRSSAQRHTCSEKLSNSLSSNDIPPLTAPGHTLVDRLLEIRNAHSMSKRNILLKDIRKNINFERFVFEDTSGYRHSWRSYEKQYLLCEKTLDYSVKVMCRVYIKADKVTCYILETEWNSRNVSSESNSAKGIGFFGFYECCDERLTRYFLFQDRLKILSSKKFHMTVSNLCKQSVWESVVKYVLKKGFSPHTSCTFYNFEEGSPSFVNFPLQK